MFVFNFDGVSTEWIMDWVGLFISAELITTVLVVKYLIPEKFCDKLGLSALSFGLIYYIMCSYKNFLSDKYIPDGDNTSEATLARMFCGVCYALNIIHIVNKNKRITKNDTLSKYSSKISLGLAMICPFVALDVVYTYLSLGHVFYLICCIMTMKGYNSENAIYEKRKLIITLVSNIIFLIEYNLYIFVFPNSIYLYGPCNFLESLVFCVYHGLNREEPKVNLEF
jgi:hypothetical protein